MGQDLTSFRWVHTMTADRPYARSPRRGNVLGRVVPAARIAYGLGVSGLGSLCLLGGDLRSVFQPVPKWLPWPHALGYASGALLLAGGVGLLAPRVSRLAAGALTVYFLVVWLLGLNLSHALAHPSIVGNWEGCGLAAAVAAGGWTLFARSQDGPTPSRPAPWLGERGAGHARRLFAVGVPLVGLAHFADAQGSTVYVPSWLPLPVAWVYLTGAAHVAAGLAILSGVWARRASILEAAQITSFVLLTHVPAVLHDPSDRIQWGMLVYAVAIAASGWLVASTLVSSRPRGRGRSL